jgi:hypothetical protein
MQATLRDPIRLAGSTLKRTGHVCAFFHSNEEKYRVLMPFIKDGIACGDRSFHIVDPNQRKQHVRRLEQEGIDVAGAEAAGRFEVFPWQEAYLKDNQFDQHRMLELVKAALAKQQPGEITRFVGNMEWALEDFPGVEDLLEYESRLNEFLPKHRDPVVCCYDLSRFDASIVIDIMNASDGHHRRDSSGEPVLRAAGGDAERVGRTKGGEARRLIVRPRCLGRFCTQ